MERVTTAATSGEPSVAEPRVAEPRVAEPAVGRGRPTAGKYTREAWTNHSFSLVGHLLRTFAVAGLIFALGVYLARDASAVAWLGVPGFWVIANLFEWGVHRYPMHHPLQPRMMYFAHALVHHNAFAGPDMEIDDVTELSTVMMPWYTLIVVFAMAAPIAVVAWLVGGAALAGVFLVAAVGYFLVYETIHTLHHVPAPWLAARWWGRSRFLAWLRAHHHRHHQLEKMTRINFNVTLPLGDALFGTYER